MGDGVGVGASVGVIDGSFAGVAVAVAFGDGVNSGDGLVVVRPLLGSAPGFNR